MAPQAIALASLRLAPVQCASFGHAASTMSSAIDYMVLPEDFAGSTECYSEQVVALPKRAMPFVPRKVPQAGQPLPPHPAGAPLRVAIPASTMKLNPRFFNTLAQISERAKTPVEFRFFPLAATGLPYLELKRVLAQRLPGSRAFKEAPHDAYIEALRQCDMFLSPFPYGNTNSIVDALQVGLPGVCLDGPEPHAHIDAGLFARVGFPQENVATSIEDYILAATKLIDNVQWRSECRDIAVNCDLDRAFFEGDPRLFCEALARLVWPSGNPRDS
jgi:predicted O-linked N-acetylglucosamine transferase (SPINDLY family)